MFARRVLLIVLLCVGIAPLAYAKCPTLPRELEFGDIGEDVIELQQFLKGQGVSGDDGNIFGEKTLEAVKFWQGSQVLPQTGRVDAAVRKRIGEICKTEPDTVVRDNLSVRPMSGNAPLTTSILLTLGDGADNRFIVDFGDGATASANACTPDGTCKTSLQAKHTYKDPGKYVVQLFRDYGTSTITKNSLSGKSAVMQTIVTVDDPVVRPVPETCEQWFDGCSVCTRKAIGAPLVCPKKTCYGKSAPRSCKAFFYINKPPVVKVTGPKNVSNSLVRSYVVTARDPEGAQVTYAIDWGEGAGTSAPQNFFKGGTFTHRFTQGGVYTVTGFARDAAGDVGTARMSVFVRDARDEEVCDAKYAPVCGETKVCTTPGVCSVVRKIYGNACIMDKAHATKVPAGTPCK
jgi:peptidoglycan hydrolase-like protein with peptidoglycan-binding domain